MQCVYQREKRQEKLKYLRRKQFKDPCCKILGKSKQDHKVYKHAKALLNSAKWSSAYPDFNLKDLINENYSNYIKIKHLVGYSGLEPSPYWFRNLSLNFLFNLYDKWIVQAKNLCEDYYLKLWVFDNDFTQSQIVFALNSKAKKYRNIFDKNKLDCSIPYLNKNLSDKMHKYEAQYCKDLIPLGLEDLQESGTDQYALLAKKMGYDIDENLLLIQNPAIENLESFLKSGFIEDSGNDDDVYLCHVDNVWVIGSGEVED